jgi:hypothetical protein
MKRLSLVLVLLLSAVSCMQKRVPVATKPAAEIPADRIAIAVEYVSVPKANVYASDSETAAVIGNYGMIEAVSVLEKKGDWCLVRTYEGTGWMKRADLVTGAEAEKIDTKVPRFYVEPAQVPYPRRGEIWFQAKVNTDGEVIDVLTVKNTTGSESIAQQNEAALKAAKFYPMIDSGVRKTFVYEYRVFY